MNEELMIKIKASVDEALKKLDDVTKELKDIGDQSKKSSKEMSDSMKSATRSALLQVEAIKKLASGMINLGRNSLIAQKEISKLNAAFESAGSSAGQAGKTYIDLYRFMGDSGAATEAAQSLARITTNTQDLAEWAKILQGVYARAGDAIPVESLAEAANETIKVGKVTGSVADALNWLGVSEDAFNSKLAQTNSAQEREVLLRSTLNSLYMNAAIIYERNNSALLANAESQARLDIALAEAGRVILPLMTAVNNLASTLLTSLKPAIEVVAMVMAVFVEYIIIAVKWIAAFFSLFSGKSGSAANTTKDVANNVDAAGKSARVAAGGVGGLNKALGSAANAAKELRKQTMGFDELNVVSSQSSSASGSGAGAGGGGGASIPALEGLSGMEMPNLEEFTANLEKVREKAQAILSLVGGILAGILLWKIADFIIDLKTAVTQLPKIKELIDMVGKAGFDTTLLDETQNELQTIIDKAKLWGGLIMIVAGAILLVTGYCDAWVNGIDWGNFSAMLAGLALIVGGIALAFGPVYAGVAAIAGGIALLVVGIKDFVTNGYSMENVLTILAGVIAIVVGVCLAFNAALLANPITWIVVGIAALVAAFVILWNECEGFRNFWLDVWEKAKEIFAGVIESLTPLWDAIVLAFQNAWELIKVVWDMVAPYFALAWEAIKIVWDVVADYFGMIWDNIELVFSVVVVYFEGMFKTAWEAIKTVWNAVVGYFTALWNSIALVFSVVKDVLTGNWQGAWDGIKGIVDTWKNYFSGVWSDIKGVFSAVKTWFKDTFSEAWSAVKGVFNNWTTFFSGLWDKIKDTFSSLGTKIGDAVGGAVKTGINKVIDWVENTINNAIGLINGAIGLINQLPGVKIGKLTPLTLPRLAKGGIVDSATIAMIGEQGKEAVIPLENNTQWMDTLADRITQRNSAPSKIVLMLDGKELGWASINQINNITKQSGSLPLVIA